MNKETYMIRQLTLEEVGDCIKDDTVRPHLSAQFRISHSRQVWGLFKDQDISPSGPQAVICVAYCTSIPETEFELAQQSRAPTDSEHELAATPFDPALFNPSAHTTLEQALEQARQNQGNLKAWPCGTVTNKFGETMVYDTSGNLAPCVRGRHIKDTHEVAVFYTVWSYNPGAGRQIVNQLAQHIRDTNSEIVQWVTLSPLTEMAEKFHTKNGAKFLASYDVNQTFEYTHLMITPEQSE
jgi:hypothetical protein|tara:strand:+ start:122 stop:838 length:717 start_codon:yes stop_codon:yes gene_type:complete